MPTRSGASYKKPTNTGNNKSSKGRGRPTTYLNNYTKQHIKEYLKNNTYRKKKSDSDMDTDSD